MSDAPPGFDPRPEIPPSEPLEPSPGEPAERGPDRVGWGPSEILLGLLAVPFLSLLGGAIGLAISGGDADATSTLLIGQATLGISFVAVAIWFARRKSTSPAAALGVLRSHLSGRIFSIAILSWLGYVALAAAFIALVDVQPNQDDIARDLGFDESTLVAVIVGILIVGLAPIAEELFFRGFIFAGLRSAMPMALAAIISGVLFGAIHLTAGDVVTAGQLSILGVILAVVYERTGTLWTPIIIHAINNSVAFAVLAADPDLSALLVGPFGI